mmetsp:Transcript_17173/g.15165  ORF Transcript_17173/g.15165 Transcript_17173/m.15165 type:complete len:184 (+) Transcript_17173:192-743(+)
MPVVWSAVVLVFGEIITRHLNSEVVVDIMLTLVAVGIIRIFNIFLLKKYPGLFKMTLTSIIYVSITMILIFIILKSLITSSQELIPVDLSRLTNGEFHSISNIFSGKFLLLLSTEIIYSVIFTIIDGILDKSIKIKDGETSVKGLVNDLKLQMEEDRIKREGKFKSYLPSQTTTEGVRKRNTT